MGSCTFCFGLVWKVRWYLQLLKMFEDCRDWNLMAKIISASLFCRYSVASRRILMRLGPRDLSCKFCLERGIEFAWAKFHYNLLQLVSLTSESCAFKKHLFWICLGKRSHDPTRLQGWFWMVAKYTKNWRRSIGKKHLHLAKLPGKVALVHLQRRRIVQRSGRDEIR